MLIVAWSTLRTRWATLVGPFVALALGVGLIATMGLALASTLDAPRQRAERFAMAPVVVHGPDELRVRSPVGDRTRPLAHPRGLPRQLAADLAATGHAVADRSFPVRLSRASDDADPVVRSPSVNNRRQPLRRADLVGHPWSIATYGGYRLAAGRGPRGAGEVVVSDATALVGTTMTVRTSIGESQRTVVGVVSPVPFEQAMFFTDAEAATLSPRIDNLVVDAAPDVVRAVVGTTPDVMVLTGGERYLADPDPNRDRDALVAVNALLGTAGGVTAFVSIFVVASTFAFAVAQRRREIGLLRTAGATPGQVRRMMLIEAAVVGVLASASGCVFGAYGAPRLAYVLVEEQLALGWFAVGGHRWPYHVAFWIGLLVALAGATVASIRAGRIRPVEALREASVDARAMTPGRWVFGIGLLATGLGLLCWRLAADPGDALHRKTYTTQPMLLITAVALLAPILVRPLTRLLAWIPAQLPGATGMLVRENATAGVRRTAAIAAPVLITMALAGSLLGASATINKAKATEIRGQTVADLIIDAGGAGMGFDDRTVRQVRAVPGAEVTASTSTAVYVLEGGTALIRSDAQAITPGELLATRNLPVLSGRLADLDDSSIVVNEEWADHTVGDRVDVWLGDGSPTALRIAAVIAAGTGNNGVYITPRNAPGVPPDRIEVKVRTGADATAIAESVRAAVQPTGAKVLTRSQWITAEYPDTTRQSRIGFVVVLGIALVYTGIALANTLVMATADRVRDFAVLRLAGATRRQVVLLTAVEALTVVVVGAVLGTIVTALNLLGIWGALGALSVRSAIVVPWQALAVAMVTCTVVATVAALLPTLAALRNRRVGLADSGE